MEPLNQQPVQQPTGSAFRASTVSPTSSAPERKKIGLVVSILAVVLVLIIAALYIFSSAMNTDAIPSDMLAADENAMPAETIRPITNTADDTASIEADLDASVQGLDSQNF